MSGMNVLSPHVSIAEEYGNRVRNVGAVRRAQLEEIAQNPHADVSELSDHERGIVECYRKMTAH